MNKDSLSNKVYNAAKNGNAMTLYVLLNDLNSARANEIINETIAEEYGGRYTPLIIATECRHERVIRMLLSKFKPDLEMEGIIIDNPNFDDVEIFVEGTTALWCAAKSGYLKGVKLLVEAGADVNHATRTNLTPLQVACREGHLDIVKYLTDHYADVNIADTHKSTCLMVAIKRGHLHVVNLLLENKADPNVQASCGTTALHYAAEYGHISILKKLLKCNANFFVNDIGMTPMKAAADNAHVEIVEYLFSRPEISKEEKIEALELLGASYASIIYDTQTYCAEKGYKYLHQAMKMRYSDPDNIIEKKLIKPIPAYENWVESRNLSELEALEHNSNGLDMEGLTIRERILGVRNPKVANFLIFRADVFADDDRFDRCLQFYLYALRLKQSNEVSTAVDLQRFTVIFTHIVEIGLEVTYDNVVQLLDAVIVNLERSKPIIASLASDSNRLLENESSMASSLSYLMILTTLFNKYNEEERLNVERMVSTLNDLQPKLDDGKTLLHAACYKGSSYLEAAQLLIRCGANVNATDCSGNTPYHLFVSDLNYVSDLETLQIIKDLAEAGAHIYCLINQDITSLNSMKASVAEKLKTQANLRVTSLKCIAAFAVTSHGLSYQGQVPQALQSFIELHRVICFETTSD